MLCIITVAFHSLMDRGDAHVYLARRRDVEDKAHHRQTTAGGGAYRDRSRGMRASSRAPSDLRVILQVRSSSWQLIAVPLPYPAALNPSPLNATTGERKDRGERAGMDENALARVAHSSLRTIASFRFIKSIAEHSPWATPRTQYSSI